MHVTVNGAKLYVDIEGAGLVADGPRMRQKPTLVLLHGGPGFDHTTFKPAFAQLTDICQIVYVDHRGNGRSEDGDPANWNLAQWGDDVKGLCDVLGIEKPIIYGVSFGGFVAQSYATRHPDHPSKLVLTTTAAKMDYALVFEAFERLGGREARNCAEAFWMTPTPERRARYIELCHPLYNTRELTNRDFMARGIIKMPVSMHFNGPTNEVGRMDFTSALASVKCPVLVMGGDSDPITPIAFSERIAAALPPHLVRFERFANTGHGIVADDPAEFFRILREFILDP